MGVFQIQMMSLFGNAQRKLDGDDNIPATVPARMEKIRCRKLEMVSLQRKSSLSTSGSSGSRTRQLSTSWDMKCEKRNLTRGLGDEVVGLDTYTALAKTMLLMMLWKKVRTRFQLLEFLT